MRTSSFFLILVIYSLSVFTSTVSNGQSPHRNPANNRLTSRSEHITRSLNAPYQNIGNLPTNPETLPGTLKDPSTLNYQMDTISCYSNNSYTYISARSYNSLGKITGSHSKYFQNNSTWSDWYRDTFTYDTDGNLITYLQESDLTGTWENALRYTYTYNLKGEKTMVLDENWLNGNWVNFSRMNYTYDTLGNRLTSFLESWDNGSWTNTYRFTESYDANGLMLTSYEETWTNGAWVNSSGTTMTYDPNGYLSTVLYENWVNNTWENTAFDTFGYDQNGNMLLNLYQDWDNGIWVNVSRNIYTYNVNKKMLTNSAEVWNGTGWGNAEKIQYTYDSNNIDLLTELDQLWLESDWANSDKFVYTYDNNYNALTGDSYNWDGSNWVQTQDPGVLLHYNGGYMASFNGYHVNVHYLSFANTVNDLKSKDISVFRCEPNPASTSTKIVLNLNRDLNVELSLSSLTGNTIKTLFRGIIQKGEHRFPIATENLPAGTYLAVLKYGQRAEAIKVVVER